MNTQQISQLLGSIDTVVAPYFRGTYTSDKLHLAKSFIDYNKPNVICCFTASSQEKYGHWLLIYVTASNVLFVDSFAKEPGFYGQDIAGFVNSLGPYNLSPFRLQSNDTVVCGAYVCYIVHYLVLGNSLGSIYAKFNNGNYLHNDMNVLKWLYNNFGFIMDLYKCNSGDQSCASMNYIIKQKIK